MATKRNTKKFRIHEGTLQARGLYNIIPKDESDTRISFWFDKDTKRELDKLSVDEFNAECERILNRDNY